MLIARLSVFSVILTCLGIGIYSLLHSQDYISTFIFVIIALYAAAHFYNDERKRDMYVITEEGRVTPVKDWKPIKGDDTRWK